MARPQTQVPDSVRQSIKAGRFAAAAETLRGLAARDPSAPILAALSDMALQLGLLTEARDSAQKAVVADPTYHNARVMLARSHVALDENEQAIADFKLALAMARPGQSPAPNGPVPVPAHQALHTLEQLVYVEQAEKRPPGSLLPVDPNLRAAAQAKLEQMLADTAREIPTLPMGGAYGRILADPPLLRLDEPAPTRCLNPRADWDEIVATFNGPGKGIACFDGLLTPEALDQLQRFCLHSTVWRRPYPPGYIGASPETGFFSPLLLQIAAELREAVPGLLGGHHLSYWWSFVCQHQRPGTDIHADQSDVSINFWITPDSANLDKSGGGLDMWDVQAPADWSFADYNNGEKDIEGFLRDSKANRSAIPYGENRALLFHGLIFHQSAHATFKPGFENRRRNVTMLFRKTRG